MRLSHVTLNVIKEVLPWLAKYLNQYTDSFDYETVSLDTLAIQSYSDGLTSSLSPKIFILDDDGEIITQVGFLGIEESPNGPVSRFITGSDTWKEKKIVTESVHTALMRCTRELKNVNRIKYILVNTNKVVLYYVPYGQNISNYIDKLATSYERNLRNDLDKVKD